MTCFARLLHRHYWLSALLLGCLVLRAFVPAGYMLEARAGDVSLKMCSGLTMPSSVEDSSADHALPDSDGPTGHQGACPAGAPLLALAFALTLSAELPDTGALLPPADTASVTSIPPSPSRLPRGPPSLLV